MPILSKIPTIWKKKEIILHVQYDISENLYIVFHLVIRAARN